MITPEDQIPSGGLKVRLHPFLHQVSGSTLMFKFDNGTLCKPLLPKEYNFYKFLPDSLREFTAKYKGSIEIQFEEDSDGTVHFFGIVPPAKVTTLNLATADEIMCQGTNGTSKPLWQRPCVDYLNEDELRLKRSGSIEMDEDSLDCYDNPGTKLETGTRLNKRLAEMLGGEAGTQHRFILLENLVAGFEHPSILDLKMGTRTHGDDDSESKKRTKRKKAEMSTSKELGVRLHGMQKYNLCSEKFETLTKYDGLTYSPDEFKRVLLSFLHDGTRLREEVIAPIYNRLKHYYQCVSQQDTFRFYSSSMLIIYEGGRQHPQQAHVDVRAIDFAHTTHESSPHAQNGKHVGPDKGYLLGIQSLIDIFGSMIGK